MRSPARAESAGGLRGVADRALVAHAFLTRLRLPVRGSVDPGRFGRAAVLFPLVGVTVGGAAALVRLAVEPVGPIFATVAALSVPPLLTGALHEDGLADTADALGPHERRRRLEAMRDPHLGAFGVLALVLSVAARIALLAPLGARAAALALVAAHVLGRWSTLPLALAVPPVRNEGAGALLRPLPGQVLAGTALALALAAPALLACSPPVLLAGLAAALAVTALTGLLWRRAFGGVTGDTFGATNQLVEIAVYVAVVGAT